MEDEAEVERIHFHECSHYIAVGSGKDIQELNQFIKQFEQMKRR